MHCMQSTYKYSENWVLSKIYSQQINGMPILYLSRTWHQTGLKRECTVKKNGE